MAGFRRAVIKIRDRWPPELTLMARLACLLHGLAAATPGRRGEVYATSVTALLIRLARALRATGRGAAGPGQPVPQALGGRAGLSPEDNQLLFESVARLSAAKPSQTGRSEAWSNLQMNSSGSSTILRVFH